MRKIYAILVLFLMLGSTASILGQAGQCLGGGCAGPGTSYGAAQSTTSSTFVNSLPNTYAGEYNTYNVTSGQQYEWSLCPADGAVNPTSDAQLTLKNTSNGNICYSDDLCGAQPKILWTATFTGQVRVLVNRYNCATNSNSHTVRWRCVSCGPPPGPPGCTNTTAFGSAAAPTNNVPVTISTCTYQNEYNTITGVAAGSTYQSGMSLGGFITVRSGTFNGPVVASGNSPLTWTATIAGNHFIHYNTNSACGTATTCGTTTITCTSCPAPAFNPCTTIPNIAACATPVSTTWTAGQIGAWSPIVNTCGFSTPGQERLFTFTPTVSGIHQINVTAITGGYLDFFWKAASGGCNNTGWNCILDVLNPGTFGSLNLTAGVQYYIMADPEHTNAGTLTMNIVCPPSFNAVPFSGSNTYTLCSGNLYDHGGPSGNYSDNANGFTVLNPSILGNMVQVSGTVSAESCCDFLRIYNGVGIGGTLLWQGNQGAVPVITSTSGPLTVQFISDGSVIGTGFDLTIACVLPPPPSPTSVTASTNSLCSNSLAPVNLTANGASGTVYWFTGSCATTGQFATGNSVVVNPASTTTYFARNFDGVQWSTTCASTTVTVNTNPAAPSVTASLTSICQGGSTNLNGTGLGTISWFDAPTGGNLVGTSASGADFNVAPTSNTTYYAETTGPSIDSIVYNQSFTQGVAPFTQALNWCTFRSNLLNSYGYVSLTIRGSANPTGITITDPVEILNIANAMRTANLYTGTIGGNTWNVTPGCVAGSSPCGGSPGVVLHLNTTSCNCDPAGTAWVIRPEINNDAWGGIGTGTCSAPSQSMEVVFRYNTGSGGCPSPRTPIAITVDAPSVAPTSITNLDPNICNGASTQLDVVGGSLSAGAQWEWSDVSCGGAVLGNGASLIVTPNGTTTYYVRASAGNACAASACESIAVAMPTASTNLAIDGDVATCVVNSGNWIHFYNVDGRLIASVNSAGQDLGNVTATSLVAPSPYVMPSCTQPSDPSWFNAALARSFIITPTTQPTNAVSVRLYILDSEFNDYQTSALGTTQNANDDVSTITDMDMTKHSSPFEDGNPLNNCGVGSTIYVPQSGSGLTSAVMGGFSGSYYIEYSISSFSEMFPMNSSNSALPVTMTSFNANCAGDKVNITWTTASEFNASHYSLQTSRDGQTWTEVAEIAAAGTTSQESNYAYQDFLFGGVSYYRLVQVDLDGASEIYGPISVDCEISESSMTVYPNPTNNDFTVLIQTTESFENATIELVDLSGRAVEVKEMNILPGSTQVRFETKGIMPGTYIMRIKGENDKFTPIRVVVL
jgi:hypothetical protein